jgi:hypothetical protein
LVRCPFSRHFLQASNKAGSKRPLHIFEFRSPCLAFPMSQFRPVCTSFTGSDPFKSLVCQNQSKLGTFNCEMHICWQWKWSGRRKRKDRN